jgi:hypothetical protein
MGLNMCWEKYAQAHGVTWSVSEDPSIMARKFTFSFKGLRIDYYIDLVALVKYLPTTLDLELKRVITELINYDNKGVLTNEQA